MRTTFLLLLVLFVLPPGDCGGTPDPDPVPAPTETVCEVCDPSDVSTCSGVPSRCAKTGSSYCCVR